MKTTGKVAAAVLAAAGAWAVAAWGEEWEAGGATWKAGADLRLRQEAFDNIPLKNGGVTRGGANDYWRIRPRAYAGVQAGIVGLDVRILDEFRIYDCGAESSKWPDEAVFDQLVLTLAPEGLGRLTAGRQDMVLGSGRLWADGTPKDGSRTGYFDGVRWHWEDGEGMKVDAAGVYTQCEDPLAIGNVHRDVTGYTGGFNSMDEAAAALFAERRKAGLAGCGGYAVWKHDTAWRTAAGERVEGEDIWTAGVRWLPEFGDGASAEVEAALQWGDSDGRRREASFAAGSVKVPAGESGGWWGFGGTHLSGDKGDTGRREDFNVLFGRYPWISELMIYAFDGDGVGTWNNLAGVQAEGGWDFGKGWKAKGTAGPLWAEEHNGSGGGLFRGWLATGRLDFKLCKGLTGHLQGEMLLPGEYYESRKTAYFARWDLSWAF